MSAASEYTNMPLGEVIELPPPVAPAAPEPPPFVDLGPYLSGDIKAEKPSVAEVMTGRCLLYAGRINEVHGEPGTGKSNVAIAAMNKSLSAGGVVLYIDPEDTPLGFCRRALLIGGNPAFIGERVKYLHNPTAEELSASQAWAKQNNPDLVILDGVAESLVAAGMNEDSNTEVLQFLRDSIRPFADLGAAVLLCDHVTKSQDSRGRFARGAGSKLGRYDGAVYQIESGKAYTPEEAGFVRLRVAKDRNGGVGVRCGEVAFEVHFTPGDENTCVEFIAPATEKRDFFPTFLMEKVSRFIELHPAALSGNQVEKGVPGNAEAKRSALRILLERGFIKAEQKGRANLYVSVKPFRELDWKATA
jgi:hypothetical protein